MTALLGLARAADVGAALSGVHDVRPPEPHAYLHLLGVDPDRRGQGLGGEVLQHGLAAARAAGLVACLETMNPANVPFYEAHGLVVRGELQLPSGGPRVWAMATPG
jgi:ribosomal protein S18 acetylase RimI-like enzyme